MKKLHMFSIVSLFVFFSICRAESPIELAGFELGENIEKFENRLKMDTIIPTRHFESFKEVEIQKVPGFKSGLVYFGTCDGEKRIIKIKLKYRDSSMEFFTGLFARLKKRFGQPDQWKGDPFHVVNAWKWSFLEENGKNTSMTLRHNAQNPNQKTGNSIKITRQDLLGKEYECFQEKDLRKKMEHEADAESEKTRPPDWDKLMPKGKISSFSRLDFELQNNGSERI